MTREEEDQLTQVLASNPGLAVTPQVLLQFIAMRTTSSPRYSPEGYPPMTDHDFDQRGRSEERDYDEGHSRSSSRDSTGTSVYRPPSRGSSGEPKTPISRESPFDASRRQRSTPLGNTAPSSWSRRPPPSRRKSDAGSRSRASSDSEVNNMYDSLELADRPFAFIVHKSFNRVRPYTRANTRTLKPYQPHFYHRLSTFRRYHISTAFACPIPATVPFCVAGQCCRRSPEWILPGA